MVLHKNILKRSIIFPPSALVNVMTCASYLVPFTKLHITYRWTTVGPSIKSVCRKWVKVKSLPQLFVNKWTPSVPGNFVFIKHMDLNKIIKSLCTSSKLSTIFILFYCVGIHDKFKTILKIQNMKISSLILKYTKIQIKSRNNSK